MPAASERPEGELESFLWTRHFSHHDDRHIYTLRPLYQADWPGKVAVVVGGSVDMRNIRASLKDELREMGVTIITFHRQLLTEKRQKRALQGKVLLLATEGLFSKDASSLRDSLNIVFDTCECHRIKQKAKEGYGWCDCLETLTITQSMMQHRRRCASLRNGQRYIACKRLKELPVDKGHCKEMSSDQKHQRVPHDFIGFPLPDVHPKAQDIFELIEQYKGLNTNTLKSNLKRDDLSFNGMPLAHLLAKSLESNVGSRHKLALILAVSAAQLTNSSAFAMLFQSQRDLLKSRQEKWDLAEIACPLRMYLSLGGSTSVEVGIVVLCMQHMLFGKNVEDAEVGDGRGLKSLIDFIPSDDAKVVIKDLLMIVIRLTREFSQEIFQQLQAWPRRPDDASVPSVAAARRQPGDLDFCSLVSFLEGAMRQATEPSIGKPNVPQKFDLALNPEEGVLGFRCQASPLEPGQGRVLRMCRYDAKLKLMDEVFRKYDCLPTDYQSGCAIFDRPGATQGDHFKLLTCLDIYQHLAEHDQKVARERDDTDSQPQYDPLLANIWFGHYEDPEKDTKIREKKIMEVLFCTRPLWLLNPDTNPSGQIIQRRVYALKRSVIPGKMFLASTLVGEWSKTKPENTPAAAPVADQSDTGDGESTASPGQL